jgi:hypothetical protein
MITHDVLFIGGQWVKPDSGMVHGWHRLPATFTPGLRSAAS